MFVCVVCVVAISVSVCVCVCVCACHVCKRVQHMVVSCCKLQATINQQKRKISRQRDILSSLKGRYLETDRKYMEVSMACMLV